MKKLLDWYCFKVKNRMGYKNTVELVLKDGTFIRLWIHDGDKKRVMSISVSGTPFDIVTIKGEL